MRRAERRAQLVAAACGKDKLAAFWRVVDAKGVRSLAESAKADTVPDVVGFVSGLEFTPAVAP